MKVSKAISLILIVLLVIALSPQESMAYKNDALLSDDFEDLSADGWDFSNASNWQVVEDYGDYALYQGNTRINAVDDYLNEAAIYSKKTYSTITFTAAVRTAENIESNPEADFGLIFHYQDQNNFYYVSFNAKENETVLLLRRYGEDHVLARCATPQIDHPYYFTVSVKLDNGKIEITSHDIKIFQYFDDTFVRGKIGVGTKDDAVYFDDIIVCELRQPECDFYEDFNRNMLTGWTGLNPERWSTSFKNHASYILYLNTGLYESPGGSRLGELITIDNLQGSDFSFECDMMSIEWYANTDADLAMIFCYYDENNYYAAIFNRGENLTKLVRIKNGESATLDSYQPGSLIDLAWHHAKVEAHGNTYKVFFDGKLILQQWDNQLIAGKFGLGSLNDSGYFDNVCLNGEGLSRESIALTSPNGGENFVAGTPHTVSWLSEGVINNVALQYTVDDGQNWTPIISSVANNGSYSWTVPTVNSSDCRVRVLDIDSSPKDASNGAFTIRMAGELTVLSPNGGETLQGGGVHNITWSSTNTSGLVDIDYTIDGGASWTPVAEDAADSGIYAWTVPNHFSNNCKIRVTDVVGAPMDESNGWFTIQQQRGSIAVQAPNGGEVLSAGSPYSIQWTSSQTSGQVNISFSADNGAAWTPVAQNIVDSGSYAWSAPLLTSEQCKIRIADADSSPMDESDAVFSIIDPADIVLIQPACADSQVSAGSSIWLSIQIGTEENPVNDLFGASFTLLFPADTADVVAPFVQNVLPGEFLGDDILFFQNVDTTGKVSVGMSRKSGAAGVSGVGELLRVQFHLDGTLAEDDTVAFAMMEISATDISGAKIPLRTAPLKLVVKNGILVWPGDADNSGKVDQADIMPLGFYWNASGAARPDANLQWQAQRCPQSWSPEAATYADCNGDGIVNQGDILAIGFNWNKTHDLALQKAAAASAEEADGHLILSCRGEGSQEQPYFVDVALADVADLLGISFILCAESTSSHATFTAVEYQPFFGADIIHFEMIDNESNQVSIGATRKADAGGVSGAGSICRVFFTLDDKTAMGESIKFSAIETSASNAQGAPLQLDMQPTILVTGINDETETPTAFELRQNYPNPFNPSTVIEYSLPSDSRVQIDIFNTLGQRVSTLTNEEQKAGRYAVRWNGTWNGGQPVSPGLYFAQIRRDNGEMKRIKMVFTK